MALAGQDGAQPADSRTPRLELAGIEKSFGAVHALRGAHVTAHAGEIVGLCGDSGSGKSTLVNILAGAYPRGSYKGQVILDGEVQSLASPADTRRAGIAVVHQRSSLVPHLSVAHNLMLGNEPRRFGLVDEAQLESQARASLERFGVADQISPSSPVGDLGTGLRQIVEIVRALSRNARVLVLDEPAASLLPYERERLFAWLRTLRKKNATTCLYVTHRMDELVGLCDRIAVLREGKTAQTLSGSMTNRYVGGRYVVHEEIASGGMATVHLGRIRGPFGFTNIVAIKRLHAVFAKDPRFVAMFLDEARLASRVRHPNVVPVLDVFAEEGDLSLVMEYVEGASVSQLTSLVHDAGGTIPIAIATAIVAAVLHGLHAAHEARDEHGALIGLVHRDVSPQNVIVGTDGIVRLIDFGIAKAAGRLNVSRSGQLKGKVAYMAPEHVRGQSVDRRTDVYGASVLLWELLTGERLFEGDSEGLVLGRVLDDVVVPPSSLCSEVPASLDAITLRGTDRTPELRFETARAMAHAIESATRPAEAHEIAEWVQAVAKDTLAARREKVTRLERAAAADTDDDAPSEAQAEARPRTPSSPTRADVPMARDRANHANMSEKKAGALARALSLASRAIDQFRRTR